MTPANILIDTEPVADPDDPTRMRSVITDAWGLVFAQGGVVMAAALRSMQQVLDRPDLRLASATATFCKPVPCGPVTTDVEVLRSGRRGAQVLGKLVAPGSESAGPNVVVTAVFTDPELDGPTVKPLRRPPELSGPPPAPEPRPAGESPYPLAFLDNTQWRTAAAQLPAEPLDGDLPRLPVWFRFADPPAKPGESWHPALLCIPGDSLGTALTVALGSGDRPIGSVSLQISIDICAPAHGTWIGIDSTCTDVSNGLASGVLYMWSEDGTFVASVTQRALLRSL